MRSRLFSRLLLPAAFFLPPLPHSLRPPLPQNRIARRRQRQQPGGRCPAPSAATRSTPSTSAPRPATVKLESLSLRFSMTAGPAGRSQLSCWRPNSIPSSPSYHQWLTPEQFGARFGLSSSDLAKVSAWLTSQGFTITSVARSSTFITLQRHGRTGAAGLRHHHSQRVAQRRAAHHQPHRSDAALQPSPVSSTPSPASNDFKLKPRSRARTVAIDPSQPLFTQTVGRSHQPLHRAGRPLHHLRLCP